MTQPLHLDPDGLREHARMVDDAAAMCDEAAAGARYIADNGQVYGEFCSDLLFGFMTLIEDHAFREIRGGRDALLNLADLVRTLADNVSLTDDLAARQIREG
ncbi:type VII secretion target [Actinoplanes aureus]|jgi:hypothetical protein|uniref:Uncharacterized protein n=1 Tax=Actinoplanes aureus TaxID=2792083 RepID=A0A931C8S2_9ACTN|nr:type VII secretion target [Actinoplanes aureus]MBG0563016.1 hypothetical protein [Actinoplanes aureus]